MDAFERNELRLAALAKVDPAARQKYFLGRLLEVDGETPETATYRLDFSASYGPEMPAIAERGVPVKNPDKDLEAVLNGDGMRLIDLPGLRELPITELNVQDVLTPHDEPNPAAIRAFLKRPELARIRRLDMRGVRIGAASTAIASSKHLGALEWLDLSFTSASLAPLLKAKNLGGLRHLGYRGHPGNKSKTADLLAIVKSTGLAGLRSLSFSGNRKNDDPIEDVAAAPELARFESLQLWLALSGSSWRALAESPHTAGLRRFGSHYVFSDQGAGTFLANPRWQRLEQLELGSVDRLPAITLPALKRLKVCFTSSALGVRDLAGDPALGRLDDLDFSIVGAASVEALPALYASPGVRSLRSLSMMLNLRTEQGLPICQLPHFERLRHLEIRGLQFDGPLMVALVESGALRTVESLFLEGPIGEEGARALAASPDAARLKELRISGANLEDGGLTALAESPHLQNLQVLDLGQGWMTERGLEALLASDNFRHLVQLAGIPLPAVPPGLVARVQRHENMPKLWTLTAFGKVPDPELCDYVPYSRR